MHRYITIITLFLTGFCTAEVSEDVTVRAFKIDGVTLFEAIKELNIVISKQYPGRKDLLVAYIESPHPVIRAESRKQRLKLNVANNPPIATVVQYLVDLSRRHFRIFNGRIIVYDWNSPVTEQPIPKK